MFSVTIRSIFVLSHGRYLAFDEFFLTLHLDLAFSVGCYSYLPEMAGQFLTGLLVAVVISELQDHHIICWGGQISDKKRVQPP